MCCKLIRVECKIVSCHGYIRLRSGQFCTESDHLSANESDHCSRDLVIVASSLVYLSLLGLIIVGHQSDHCRLFEVRSLLVHRVRSLSAIEIHDHLSSILIIVGHWSLIISFGHRVASLSAIGLIIVGDRRSGGFKRSLVICVGQSSNCHCRHVNHIYPEESDLSSIEGTSFMSIEVDHCPMQVLIIVMQRSDHCRPLSL
ncbi:hypothetical protein AVEN_178986-1 [Araneus ventricosus]|uniref:Uncharacterized protein n=1 Tax=Araneus ventricosus TaxID=182803 RepID=A0A4Y2MRV0_ARAVE|nr:hypothetical protein AVEN_178986-1 [Araneus ventricosus]